MKPPIVPTNAELHKLLQELEVKTNRLEMEIQYLRGEHEKLKRANLGR